MKRTVLMVFSLWLVSFSAFSSISCTVNHTLKHDNVTIRAIYGFYLNDGNAVIKIDGTYHTLNDAYHIGREIRATYEKKGDLYHLINYDIKRFPVDNVPDDELRLHYPAFFTTRNTDINLIMTPVNGSDFAITYNTYPLFYCMKMNLGLRN